MEVSHRMTAALLPPMPSRQETVNMYLPNEHFWKQPSDQVEMWQFERVRNCYILNLCIASPIKMDVPHDVQSSKNQ